MFSGFQEILLIALIVLAIVLLPRMIRPQPPPPTQSAAHPSLTVSWTWRLAIVLSVLWPLGWAIALRPWRQDATMFTVVGLGPVIVLWCLTWVLAGWKNKR